MSAETGQDRPLTLQRLADDRAGEGGGGLVGLARPHHHGRKTQGPAIQKAFAAVIIDQQLANRLLRAIRGLRRHLVPVIQYLGHIAAIYRARTGENQFRAGSMLAQNFQHTLGGGQIDRHAKVEIGFGAGADHRRHMKHRGHVGRQNSGQKIRLGDIAGDHRHPVVVGQRRWRATTSARISWLTV